jgi:hypothetical protein
MSPAGWMAVCAGVVLAAGTGCEKQLPDPAKKKPAAVKASPTPPVKESGGATLFFPGSG